MPSPAISPSNVIRVLWHPRINQILTGSSSGEVHVLYSPSRSTKGATLSLSRLPRQRRADDDGVDVSQQIFTPHALPLFKDDDGAMGGRGRGDGEVDVVVGGGTGKKRKLEKERNDPQKSMKPLPPLTGPGRGGRVGASATQHVVQGLVKDSIRHEDVRLPTLLQTGQVLNREDSRGRPCSSLRRSTRARRQSGRPPGRATRS